MSIAPTSFNDCSSLTAITVNAQNSFYSSANGVLFDKNQTTLVEFPGGFAGSYAIPGGVATIGDYAFENCPSLTNITVPGSVTSIGEYAFENCAGLTNIYFAGNAPAVDSSAFESANTPTVYYLPGTTGWTEFSADAGLPVALWNPVIQTGDGGFGVQESQFGFNVTGSSNLVVVVEACTNLAESVWTPLETITLTNGLYHFSEPVRTNISGRFYGLGFP
jgi:hypothetical protein